MTNEERAWKEKLRKLRNNEPVPFELEDFDFLIEYTENYHGKTMSIPQYKKWNAICDLAAKLKEVGQARDFKPLKPSRNKRNASVILVVDRLLFIFGQRLRDLMMMFKFSDSVIVSSQEDHLRISFIVHGVWED